MKLILIISLIFTLTGCMGMPKSSQELQTNSNTRHQFIVNKGLDAVESSYDEFFKKCYYNLNHSKVYLNHVPVSVDKAFDKSKDDNHIKYSIYFGTSPKTKKYALDVDLLTVPGSGSVKVELVAATGMWKRNFPKYERVANGEIERCPF